MTLPPSAVQGLTGPSTLPFAGFKVLADTPIDRVSVVGSDGFTFTTPIT